MNAEWHEHKFGELCDVSRGASPRPIKDYISEEGMPWVKIADATASDSKFIVKTKERIKIDGVSKSVTVRPGDLILSNSATPGLPRFMKIEACIHDGWMLLRNFRGLDKEFAYWLLLHERMNLVAQGNGSVFTNLKTDILRNHRVLIPAIDQQKEIAKLLNCLSDKIQINVEINQTLEKIAQAIFKSWFVDFEPVKAKIAARQRWHALQPVAELASPVCYADDEVSLPDLETYMNLAAMQAISGKDEEQLAQMQAEQPEQYAQLLATAELFPSAMQESELGEIPDGWSPVRVEVYFDLFYGKALKKTDRVDGQCPVYGSGGITGSHNKALVSGPGIIVGRKGTVGSIYWEDRDFYPIDTAYYVSTKENYSLLFVYYLLQTLGLENMNTDAAVPGLNRNNVYRLEVPCFPVAIIECFDRLAKCLSTEMAALRDETELLTSLRDALLPKLLSGELTLRDAG